MTYDPRSAIYDSQDGQVLVTRDTLLLGSEQWSIDTLAGVALSRSKEQRRMAWPDFSHNPRAMIAVLAVGSLVGFFCQLAEDSPQIQFNLVMAGVLFVLMLPIIIVALRWQNSGPEVYRLKLTCKDTGNPQTPQEYTAAYVWRDQLQARGVEQAVLQAIALGEKQSKE
jgi:hypothetical protein